jgi:hypothetical protein
VHEDNDAAGRRGKGRGEGVGRQRNRLAVDPNHHRPGERICVVGQLVAVDAVDRGDGCGDGIGA